ncbi:jg27403, partial [Pararge aegeria aegeria]
MATTNQRPIFWQFMKVRDKRQDNEEGINWVKGISST